MCVASVPLPSGPNTGSNPRGGRELKRIKKIKIKILLSAMGGGGGERERERMERNLFIKKFLWKAVLSIITIKAFCNATFEKNFC